MNISLELGLSGHHRRPCFARRPRPRHTVAEAAWAKVLASEADFLTTSLVLVAVGAVVEPTANEWEEARRKDARGDAAGAGVVDQVSFLVIRRHAITQAFTNDRHFLAAGIEVPF